MPANEALRQRTQSFVNFLNAYRVLLYCGVSFIAVSAVIANALKNYSNFYSVAIYLSKSSRSVLVLANFGFLLALMCGHIVQKIFFGSLRPNEVERLYDRLWFFITESLLAFTIFRDDFDTPFALMFGFLLFVKSFHWLASDRIEWMDQRPYPGPSLLFHARMTTLFFLLWSTDFIMFLFAVENTITNGVGGMVLFASEYGILMASVMNTILKYLLSAYELRRAGRRGGENAPPWENKSMWVFYIELSTDFLKLATYIVFFTIIIAFYGLPLNIVRDVYITARSFISRLQALHRYQTATRNMDQRYPNATEAELASMSDRTCIICREEMVLTEERQAPVNDGPNTTPKKLPCGHIFHFYCLRSWLERQQSCPTCRRNVLEDNASERRQANGAAAGAAGQQPNPLGVVDAQNGNAQGANNLLGNPLGFVGRLFGPPVQAQNPAPIQNGPPQNANINPQNPRNVANLPGQNPPGVLIQYQVHYQFPGQQQQIQQVQPQQPLQAVPNFPGFLGPGRAWQQWPVNERQNERNATSNQTSANNSPVQNTALSSSHAETSSHTSSSGIDPTNDPVDTIPNVTTPATSSPGEAAALAALRRLNSTKAPMHGGPSEVNGTAQATASTSETTRQIDSRRAGKAAVSEAQLDVPRLIPLYDFDLHNGPVSKAYQQTLRDRISDSSVREEHTVEPINQRISPETPLSLLPPTLTDEQLAAMDTLTRVAIDERLRVLEGVSGTIYRCIDELLRIRSTLPPTRSNLDTTGADISQNPAPPRASSDSSASNFTGVNADGYPRDPVEGSSEQMSIDNVNSGVTQAETRENTKPMSGRS